MDRALTNTQVRRNRARGVLKIGVPLAALAGALTAVAITLLPEWLRPSLSRARVRTAAVQMGSIEAVIAASGTVTPEIERVISSPVDARLLHVLKRPGASLAVGDPIVELDTSESELALQRLLTDVEISDNQRLQTEIALERSLADLDGRIERKALESEMLGERAAGAKQLFGQGLVAQQSLRDAELAVTQARIELAQLRSERQLAQRATDLQTTGLRLQRTALTRSADDARRVLRLATATSDRQGVLTYVLAQEGALVRRGDVIARVADLRSFRVDATVPDVQGIRIRAGAPVIIRTGDVEIRGQVAAVSPTVENGQLHFAVSLEEPSHAALRPSLNVDTLVVTDRRPHTLIVRQGPFTDNTGTRGDVFVIRGDHAVRTNVQFGLRGYETLEVLSGLRAGDEVIISDMRDYLHLQEVGIR
jgi:HlyD family secretion protein